MRSVHSGADKEIEIVANKFVADVLEAYILYIAVAVVKDILNGFPFLKIL